ncbi:DUF1080 domain-containing protein [bacterium]|nr:DUF1080 domain-containing protein [Planctomycetota bacterium]MDB4489431.1 DUF1080 domain-containing protein [bacterium]
MSSHVHTALQMNAKSPRALALTVTSCAVLLVGALAGCAAVSGGAEPDPTPRSLFDGESLDGWYVDIPKADDNPELEPTFVVRDGLLVSLGAPQGHLITEETYSDYRLEVEYRWAGTPGNCGVLVHCSTPRRLYGMFPQSIECQMYHENAGDFWCIGEDIQTPDMETRRGPDPTQWGVEEGQRRRIVNLNDGAENPAGEWNQMVIECRSRNIDVWVNGELVNQGRDCTASSGQIALQAEGAEAEFRRVDLFEL